MNREFKFRVWDIPAKKMRIYEPLELVKSFIGLNGDLGVLDISANCEWRGLAPKENYELMQYTDFKDKNGKEIYEGDIVEDSFTNAFGEKFGSERYEIQFVNGCGCFMGERTNEGREVQEEIDLYNHFFTNEFDIEYFDEDGNLKDFEVIGNVYENSKLLSEVEQ